MGLGFLKRETKSQSSLDVHIARLSWVENSNKKYKLVVIHCHFLFCYFEAGLHLARAIVALARSNRRVSVGLTVGRKTAKNLDNRLWSAICLKIMTRYTCDTFPRILAIIPCYTIYVRFFVTYTCVLSCFVGTNAHIHAHKKVHIYALQTSMWYMGLQKVVV